MVLRLARDEVQEVHRALSAAHLQVLRELSRMESYLNRRAGLELCRRKWKLEALLQQLDRYDAPPRVLEVARVGSRGVLHSEAASRAA